MGDALVWPYVFYIEESGSCPLVDFLRDLSIDDQQSIKSIIEELRMLNIQASEPLVRKVNGKLWELRIELCTNIFRLMYYFAPQQRIVLLHGFRKKTNRTPRNEIEIAQRRHKVCLKRQKAAGKRDYMSEGEQKALEWSTALPPAAQSVPVPVTSLPTPPKF